MRFLVALTLLFPLSALAAPATTRTTRPAANDPSSAPRAALLLYDKLVGPNQSDKALGLYHAATTREKAVAPLLADLDAKLAALVDAASKKWDKPTAESLAQAAGSKIATDINAAKIEVT